MLWITLALATPPDLVTWTHRALCAERGWVLVSERHDNRGTYYDAETRLLLQHWVPGEPVAALELGGQNLNVEFPSFEHWSTGADPGPWLAERGAEPCGSEPVSFSVVREGEQWFRLDGEERRPLVVLHEDPLGVEIEGPARVTHLVRGEPGWLLIARGEGVVGGVSDVALVVEAPRE